MSKITKIKALQILDSRGYPTLRVFVQTAQGAIGVASVPSGASTGSHEALELRDQDPKIYFGKSVRQAIKHVDVDLANLLINFEVSDQSGIDRMMIQADGTASKARFGANAILGVSMAACRASAIEQNVPLYQHIAEHYFGAKKLPSLFTLPCPMVNIINGGAHANNTTDFQEFMIRPIGAKLFSEGLRWIAEVYAKLKKILKDKKMLGGVGDEGGFAPDLDNDAKALELMMQAIDQAGFRPGIDITLALDCAASEFVNEQGLYCEKKKIAAGMKGETRTTREQINFLKQLKSLYPIDSIEDGLGEEDWQGWQQMNQELGKDCQIVGDDIFVTNPLFIKKAIDLKAANAVLIKLNQIGTVHETLQAVRLAHEAGFKTIISHRSGETEDTFIADFAVGTQSGQIKTGAPCRSERVAKYNRLLEIESELFNS
jgi:enolase